MRRAYSADLVGEGIHAAFAGIEALGCSRPRRALDVSQSFGDDALSSFTERLDPAVTRQAAITAVRHAQRHKAFDAGPFIGLALDGTSAGRSRKRSVLWAVPTAIRKGRSSAITINGS